MEKIVIELLVPASGAKYDFELLAQSKVSDTKSELMAIVCGVSENVAFDKESMQLFDADQGTVLVEDAYLSDLGVHDGSRLMLV